jgi:hypothetical protein
MSEPETSHIEYWVMGFNHGINQERDRIIELLQGMQGTAFATDTDKGKQTGWVLENAIVLIKEGNK